MMQNSIMRPSRIFTTALAILLIAGLLAGCSAARLGYSNGETLSYWWLNSYVGFDSDQKPWVKKHIANLFAWHRKTQLKGYVQILTRAQKRIHGNVTEAELLADYDDVKKRIAAMTDKALPEFAELALSLRPEQIAKIEEKFASNNKTYRKENLQDDVDDRQRFRYKKALKQAEYWFGNFSHDQEEQVRKVSDARPLNNELVMAERLHRQTALIVLLKKVQAEQPGREAVMAMLKDYISITMNRTANPEHKIFFDGQRLGSVNMMHAIAKNATPAQKEHFVKTLQQWIDDFNLLAK